jgi:hypothetical protein
MKWRWNEQIAKFKRMRDIRFKKFKKQREREILKMKEERNLRHTEFSSELQSMKELHSKAAAELKQATERVEKLGKRYEELLTNLQKPSAANDSDNATTEISSNRVADGQNLPTIANPSALCYPNAVETRFVSTHMAPQYVLSVMPSGMFPDNSMYPSPAFQYSSPFHTPLAPQPKPTHPSQRLHGKKTPAVARIGKRKKGAPPLDDTGEIGSPCERKEPKT